MKQARLRLTNKRKAMLCAMVSSALVLGMTGISYGEGEKQQDYSFDQVVVTATKTPVKEFEAKANISVVTREEIEKNHYADVSEALRHVQGVTILNYSASGENYSSNGLYINGAANVVYLIDGVRANTNGSTYSKAPIGEFVNMDAIERIEVLKGSASTLYGSDAQGGVINIITRKPKDGESINKLGVEYGSYGKEQYNFTHSGSKDGVYWSIDAQKRLMGDFKDGRGNPVINDINSMALNFKIGKDFDENSHLTLRYQTYRADYQRPDGGSFTTVRDYGEKDNNSFSLIYDRKISEKLTNTFSLFRNQNRLRDNCRVPTMWLMDLETVGFSDQLTYKAGGHTLTGGVDYYQDKVKDYYSAYYAGSVFNVETYQDKVLSNRAVFIQDEWELSKRWNLTWGIRFDHHSEYGNHSTPSLVLGYNQDDRTNYYVSYKEFFVAPNQYQIFSQIGSKDLQPEEGNTVEFGVNHKFDDTFAGSFNIYKQKAENIIGYRYLASAPYYQYYNTGKEDSRGWGVRLTKDFTKNFRVNVGYTYIYIDPASATANANRNGFLPRGTWNIGLDYERDKFNTVLNGRGIVDREGGYGKATVAEFKNFWVWDLAVNYKASDTVRVFAKVNNIFDKFYAEQGTDGNPSQTYWYSAPGRNYQIGMQYSF
ncbi:MAG TPA: TonB-dependent receptor [Methylomusa anaerophila]|uniref:Colicin I receptor n=1 Tax=Methylomusa anaerophila TaxID=1930071 RepID=A0A348AL81_9FIRM|nr:TonB-dependent receptor [Methylomusa anaerophila]BBB91829.1 colicin I receptor precursor [Methylomusa anaerophila]HML88438.1 TonB-dependent receptor [Methylomusa anaerophila]